MKYRSFESPSFFTYKQTITEIVRVSIPHFWVLLESLKAFDCGADFLVEGLGCVSDVILLHVPGNGRFGKLRIGSLIILRSKRFRSLLHCAVIVGSDVESAWLYL